MLRRSSDPRTRAKDAYEGIKIIIIILLVWSFGFLWLSIVGSVPYVSGNRTYTACCNVLDFCLLASAIAIALRFRKEEGMKKRITAVLSQKGSVSVAEIATEYVMNPLSVAKVFHDWAKENPGVGEFDSKTGVITRKENRPAELDSHEYKS